MGWDKLGFDFSLDCSYLACMGSQECRVSRPSMSDVSHGGSGDHGGGGEGSSQLAQPLHNQIYQKHGQELIH